MQNKAITIALALFLVQHSANAAVVRMNMNASNLRAVPGKGTSYGKDACRCIGIDNMKGYYATQELFHHVQRPLETGASCGAWEKGKHPKCKDAVPPQWCSQEWCYVDPCSCNLDVLPKATKVGVEYQGSPAYWSYNTCGGTDFFSAEFEDSCINQKSEGDCKKLDKCAWNGKQCGGKEVLETCKKATTKDEAVVGKEDCRCIGIGGKNTGKAFMYMNDKDLISYSPNVGATCGAWEQKSHPDCQKDGDKPAWCEANWCFVDPCKCKTAVAPSAVMPSNRFMRFQGKTAYFSYDTCGSKDSWTTSHKGKYCKEQKTESDCKKLDKCAWNGKDCLGKALVDICAKQESSGVLGMESPLESAAHSLFPLMAFFASFAAFVGAMA